MTDFQYLEFGVNDGVATITLNRPDAANAFNLPLASELRQAAKSVSRHFRKNGDPYSTADDKVE
ncbi:hypothetical protein HBA55_34255 [Pseudomaricurvus alkylphenolicus]|jgi:2-(1,2-epoxy-1,2-dihydrophenyl)acetyl-CoA isomerase|uniref:hypothetical protein n=1 Tax=Pseudomaricurvus alkylphenolicus TaxID=1306991 RepID=UPI0014209496|nr:hypothetical protein [Pseudomaricurvus alkylphenolicus]NIB44694.1 hypothetical protein [Pseudomaricurvus alkylphenolicus]